MMLTKNLFGRMVIGLLATLVCFQSPSLADEYKLQVGDELEISIAGFPELKQRSQIDIDGLIAVPLVGRINAAGLSVSEVRSTIQNILPPKLITQSSVDGRQIAANIDRDRVVIQVVQYRPIYTSGDVAKPGEQAYRPGMSAGQAIARAGGYDVIAGRVPNHVQAIGLRGEYESLLRQYAAAQARVRSLQSELAVAADNEKQTTKFPIPSELSSEAEASERRRMEQQQADVEKEIAYLQSAKKNADERALTLKERQEKEAEAVQADTADFEQIRALFEKGAVPTTRLAEARRMLQYSMAQTLQTNFQIHDAKRESTELSRKAERTLDLRRLDALKELALSKDRLASLETRLETISKQLLFMSSARSLEQIRNSQADIVIARRGDQGVARIKANEDTILLPGDTVEVKLGQAAIQ